MKKLTRFWKTVFILTGIIFLSSNLKAQNSKEERIINDSKKAKDEFVKTDDLMQTLFTNSYGYVIFPNMGKGGVIVGAAAGSGIVYEKGEAIGSAQMTQISVGAQIGGQAFREVIFFENKEALDRFRYNKFEFSSQTSAIAVTTGISSNAKYTDGVMVFTQGKTGLMYEATVSGQKFSFRPF